MKRTCSVDGCTRPYLARDMCSKHYTAARSAGMPPLPRVPAEDRFWAKVDKSGECWIWTGARTNLGYGQFRAVSRESAVFAHRFAYALVVGPIPTGMVLDHLCRQPSCIRPEHLEPVTQRVNILRGVAPSAMQARQTHCGQGHELSGENLKVDSRGKRRCLTCNRAWQRKKRAARRAEAEQEAS